MAEILKIEDHRPKGSNEPPAWEFLPLALIVVPGIGWEEWTQLWSITSNIDKNSKFYLGDAMVAGHREFGERFAQVVEAKYIHQQRGAMWVASRIPADERRDTDLVSWSAHREVAALDDPKHRKKILDLAEKNGWTTAEVKAAIWRLFPEAKAKQGRRGRPPKVPIFHVENQKPEAEQASQAEQPTPQRSAIPEPSSTRGSDQAAVDGGWILRADAGRGTPVDGVYIPEETAAAAREAVRNAEQREPMTAEEAVDLLVSLPAGALPDNVMDAILLVVEERAGLLRVLAVAERMIVDFDLPELAEAIEALRG